MSTLFPITLTEIEKLEAALLPCPFCGGKAEINTNLYGGDNGDMAGILCSKCTCGIESYGSRLEDIQGYAKLWNRRI